jgi:hypothetical protein
VDSVREEINEVIDRELANIQAFCMEPAKGKIAVCLILIFLFHKEVI